MIAALAFVPLPGIEEAFLDLSEIIDNVLMPIMDFIKDNYISQRQTCGNGRRNACF